MSIISALIGVDLGRRLKKLGEKWGEFKASISARGPTPGQTPNLAVWVKPRNRTLAETPTLTRGD